MIAHADDRLATVLAAAVLIAPAPTISAVAPTIIAARLFPAGFGPSFGARTRGFGRGFGGNLGPVVVAA
ncbi:hypothetical protein, partial [Paracoccus rhizosphaerae]